MGEYNTSAPNNILNYKEPREFSILFKGAYIIRPCVHGFVHNIHTPFMR